MLPQPQGSFRLFTVAGINVYLHWTWLLMAYVQIQLRQRSYENFAWNVLEYLSVFVIVTMHEFGHAFACRSVGGLANRIVLWPLGGVAVVSPPPRPGALLWSIAAGPLVNVVLVPVTLIFAWLVDAPAQTSDIQRFVFAVCVINAMLLIFNMLPVYPLDGGQIVQSLLWFVIGRARSLMVASVLGLLVSSAVAIPFILKREWWWVVMAAFIGMRSWSGLQQARLLLKLDKLPRHAGLACPFCRAAPIQGMATKCPQCGGVFDPFAFHGACPACQTPVEAALCVNCGRTHPLNQWQAAWRQA